MKLVEYYSDLHEDVKNYFLTEEMQYYTVRPQESILLSEKHSDYHSIAAYQDETLVTFFVLDGTSDKNLYTAKDDALLLRSFSTDSRYLKQGHARQALLLLPDFISQNYPAIKEVVLAVNINNLAAQKLYKKSGFIDNGTRVAGAKGQLLIFSRPISH